MAISFNNIPSTIRVPGVYSEVDNAQAVSGLQFIPYRRLLLGQKIAAGTAPALVMVQVTSVAQAVTLFGAGSMLSGMVAAALAQDSFAELWCLPIADNGAGVFAAGTITIAGTVTAAGTLNLYIAGRRIQVAVATTDTPTTIAAAVVAAITADTSLPVGASNVAGVITITAKNKGEAGNSIDIRTNYYAGDALPAGMSATIVAMASGATNPALTAAIAAMGDEWFQVIAMPYTDAANLTMLEAEMASRFGPLREIEGHAFAAASGAFGTISTLGNSRNSPHLTIVQSTAEPMPPWEKAAETASIAAYYAAIDPARPLQNLPYKWSLPPLMNDLYTFEERNLLLYDGIATTYVDSAGVMQAERLITTYKLNAAGGADASYLDSETMFTLMFIRHDWRDYVKRKYPRHKLASDGTRYGPGQAVVTPKLMKAEYVSKAREWEEAGLVENIDTMKAGIVSERNASDPNRLDMLVPPDLVNQLRIVANQIMFRL